MTNITPILAQEAGIQYQGVEDRSSKTGTYPVIGLITGSFKRGRYDKPMTITIENIKAQLGHEPDNPHYIAVLDVLMSGVPSVQVVRTLSAVDYAYISLSTMMNNLHVYINGELIISIFQNKEDLIGQFRQHGIEIYDSYDSFGCFNMFRLQNATNQAMQVVLDECYEWAWGANFLPDQPNKTIQGMRIANADPILEEGYHRISFNLAPQHPESIVIPANLVMDVYNEAVFLSRNRADGELYQYQFWVDDQLLTNPRTGNSIFTVGSASSPNIDDFTDAFSQFNVIARAHIWNNGYEVYFEESLAPRKIGIKRIGDSDQSYASLLGEYSFKASGENYYEAEFYLFDPIDPPNGNQGEH